MRRSHLPVLLAFALFVLAAPAPALAQEEGPTFEEAFEQGLEALQGGDHEGSIELFKRCIELEPARPTAYYNIACAYSLMKKKAEALEWLEKSMERGFLDFAHMERDGDMDNIRDSQEYKALVEKYSKPILERIPSPVHVPSGDAPEGGRGLLVMLHGAGSDAATAMETWRELAESHGLILLCVQGDRATQTGGYTYSSVVESVVMDKVRDIKKEHRVRDDRVFIGGFSQGGLYAFHIGIRHPELFRGVIGVGGIYAEEGNDAFLDTIQKKKTTRFYFVHGREDEQTLESGRAMRNRLADAGVDVVLRRVPGGHEVTEEAREEVGRALDWFLGRATGRSDKRIF